MKLKFGEFALDTAIRELSERGTPVSLEPKVFDLLVHLVSHRDRAVTKGELIEEIWDGRVVSDAALSSAVSAARRSIGDDGQTQKFIRTIHGLGFRFLGDCTLDADHGEISRTEFAPRVDVGGLPSIAVLPFNNISADPDQEYFVEGICEDLITALSRIGWLFVIAKGSTYSYKGKIIDTEAIAQDLGVKYLIVGSAQKAGNQIRISVQLLNGANSSQIWTERFDRKLEDVFAVQDEIVERIVGALEPQVSLAENRFALSKPKQHLDAWDCVIRAMALKSEFTDQSSRFALELLDRALDIDPSYARAYSQKAWTIAWRIHQGWEDADTALPQSIEAAEEAVRNDPGEPWAYIAWLFIATIIRDPEMLLESPRRALEINPNFAMAHSWMGAAHALTGNGERAFKWIERARQLSPRDMFKEEFDVHTSYAHFQVGDYNRAYLSAHKATLPHPHHVYPRLIMASSLGHLGNTDGARLQAERIKELVPDFSLQAAEKACVFVPNDDIARFIEGLRNSGLASL